MVSFSNAVMALLASSASAIPLLGGRFETQTDVQALLNLALDAAEMKEATDLTVKKTIYEQGVARANESGPDVSLQQLSLTAKDTMSQSPMYNIFRHAFLVLGEANEGETEGLFDGKSIDQYGDTIVQDLFDLDFSNIETEAALVMSVWPVIAHELTQVYWECSANEKEKALAALDKAAALWIGEGQETGSSDQGHLLYKLAEKAGERFDQEGNEAAVNTKIVEMLGKMQTDLFADKCATDNGYREMRLTVKKTIAQMTIPLIQNLLHHSMNVSNEGGSNFVELYALATIPRVAACDPAAYDDELHLDVLRTLTAAEVQKSIQAIQRAYSCFDLTCGDIGSYLGGAIPQCQDPVGAVAAGYSSNRDEAFEKSYLDRDVLQIDIFLKFKSYFGALDWYANGWNSAFSLKELAMDQVFPATDKSVFSMFQDAYAENGFAHNTVTSMMELVPPYNDASSDQVRQLVTGMLKHVVVYASSATAFQSAADVCVTDSATALEIWDTGAFLFIGSMEGPLPAGSGFGGMFLFSTANELCQEFSTCSSSGVASINEVLLKAIQDGADAISSGSCDLVQGIVQTQLLEAITIPLIQGTLKYASYNADLPVASTDSGLAIGDAFARGIFPFVNQVNPASAQQILTQMKFQLSTSPVPGGYSSVATAFRNAIPAMAIDCVDIGDFMDEPNVSLCGGSGSVPTTTEPPVQAPIQGAPPTSASNIAFGRYTFSSVDVADADGSFALDVRDMFSAGSLTQAQAVYENGANAITSGLSGEAGTISLQSFSTDAAQYMVDDPMFNIFKYALYEDDDLDDLSGEDFLYANDVVMEAITNGKDAKLASEGSVILNVWMVVAHRLYEAVGLCRGQASPLESLDSAVALWIGKEQGEGKFKNGWMLYSIGQSAAEFFGRDEAESKINTALMRLFNEAQTIASTCQGDAKAYISLRTQVSDLIRTLTKPLILCMLFHMTQNSKNMVELYSVAVVPQAEACSPVASEALQNALYSGYNHKTSLTDTLVAHLATFLSCQRITCDDLQTGPSAEFSLNVLVDKLCVRLDYYKDAHPYKPIAGYNPTTDIEDFARLDLDALEMEIFMQTRAYKAARDVYGLGHNSQKHSSGANYNLHTLKAETESIEGNDALEFQLLSTYYDSEEYADDFIQDFIDGTGEYALATREERSELASGALQAMVSFMSATTRFHLAVSECQQNTLNKAQKSWDSGVAAYVGSMEGLLAGGMDGPAQFMYNLGNEVCETFQTCESAGEASINQMLLFHFADGRDGVKEGQCGHVERLVTFEILPRMIIPLIQGVLHFSMESDSEAHARAHILAKSVIPLVKKSDGASATVLEQVYGSFGTIAAIQPDDQVFQAFADSLRGLNIDCNEIGTPKSFPNGDMCQLAGTEPDPVVDPTDPDPEPEPVTPDVAPLPDTATNLGDNLYVTTTYVQDKANLAFDVRDMHDSLRDGNPHLALLIYRDGKNSQVYDENGKFVSLRSLKYFSREESLEMKEEPLFNIFMYALQDSKQEFKSKNVRMYADSFVEDLFEKTSSGTSTIAAEAAVALNLWMHVAHQLYKTLKQCKNQQLRDEEGIQSIDVAAAYWIGDDQVAGDGSGGHLLYSLAERMGDAFNIDNGGQSRTNKNILKLLNNAKHELSLPRACSDSPASFIRLRRIMNQIISQMTIPLLQGLIHNLRNNDRDRVQIYALAVIPITAGCSPDTFAYLKEKLIDLTYNVIEVEDIIARIRSVYPCLNLQCNDIGVHEEEVASDAPACVDLDQFSELAGYRPASDVRDYALLDLDMREMDILLQMNAFDAAEDLYLYGKHVKGRNGGSMSLSGLATSSERSIVPEYDAFVRYYDNDSDYADKIIRNALSGGGSWTDVQRKVLVLKASQTMVMYLAVLQALYEAVSDCSSKASLRSAAPSDSWDRGAAMLIGHLEGTQANGTAEGYMYYDLAQQHCTSFGTCKMSDLGADVNQELITLLYTGRGAVLSNSCRGVRKAANEISSLLLVPVIQGSLETSVQLSKAESPVLRAEAFIYSRAVLPLVDAASRQAAAQIDKYLGVPAPASTRDTAMEVFSSFAKVYQSMGVDCEMVGETSGNNACTGVVEKSGLSATVVIVLAAIGACLLCSICVAIRSRKGKKRLPENNPKFETSNGELNHSMDLLEKAFSSNSRPRTTPAGETAVLTEDMHNDASPLEDDDDFEEVRALKSRMDSAPDII